MSVGTGSDFSDPFYQFDESFGYESFKEDAKTTATEPDDWGTHQPSEPQASSTDQLLVLVVDDSLVQRKLSRSKLAGNSGKHLWLVNTAETGERALQVCQQWPRSPDVIIIDQNMSSAGGLMLGHEVVQYIRNHTAFKDTVIIGPFFLFILICCTFTCSQIITDPFISQDALVSQKKHLDNFSMQVIHAHIYTHK